MGWFVDGFPRTFGNPTQRRVDNSQSLIFLMELNNYTDCYLSVNYYPDWMSTSPRHIQFVTVPKIFFDFDANNLEDAYAEVKKMYKYLEGKVPIVPVFSGNKGFHLYILLQPKTFEASQNLKEMLYRAHKYFEKQLNLKTLDQHVYGDFKRIARIPYTKNSKSGLWSYVIDIDMSLEEILEKAKTRPEPKEIDVMRPDITLDEFVEEFKYVPTTREIFPSAHVEDVGVITDMRFYEVLFDYYPCVWRDLQTTNPSHVSRFQAVTWLKWLGFSMKDIVAIFDYWGEEFGWEDRMNVDVRNYQIYHIYTQIPEYKPYGCKTFKENGLCIKCKRYIPFEEGDNE